MADPFGVPTVTQQTVTNVENEKLQAFGTATAVVGGATAANYRFNAPGGKVVQEPLKFLVTGVKVSPTDSGRAAVTFPKASLLTAFLPGPVGYVPPEFYGLHPEFYKQTLGEQIGSKPLGFTVSQERKDVYAVQQFIDAVASRAYKQSGGPSQYSPTGNVIPPGPIDVTTAELAFLQSLPAGINSKQSLLLQQLNSRISDLRNSNGPAAATLTEFSGPAGTSTATAAIQPGSVVQYMTDVNGRVLQDEDGNPIRVTTGGPQPLAVNQVNDSGKRNKRSKRGIDAELVHERADP